MCPRCKKSHSYNLTFKFKFGGEPTLLEAQVCKICRFIWADDKKHLAVIRKHLAWMGKQNDIE